MRVTRVRARREITSSNMFATPQSYCVTPSAPSSNNFVRLHHRASLIIKDVKRRSMRSCKRKRIERTLSGKIRERCWERTNTL